MVIKTKDKEYATIANKVIKRSNEEARSNSK